MSVAVGAQLCQPSLRRFIVSTVPWLRIIDGHDEAVVEARYGPCSKEHSTLEKRRCSHSIQGSHSKGQVTQRSYQSISEKRLGTRSV
jgi:hypothetical protein